jgi:GTPase SAR1 family protein
MSFIFKNLKGLFFPSSKKNVLILGYKKAGKSTIVEQFIQQRILNDRREETHGSRTKLISIQLGDVEHDFKITDVGGSKDYQEMFWRVDIAKSDGIIYLIDSSLLYSCNSKDDLTGESCPTPSANNKLMKCGCKDNQIFRESREAKSFAFSILDTGKPILILFNKLDLADKQRIHTRDELMTLYNISDASKYNTRVEISSALTGENVFESISWLFSQMEK